MSPRPDIYTLMYITFYKSDSIIEAYFGQMRSESGYKNYVTREKRKTPQSYFRGKFHGHFGIVNKAKEEC